MWKLNLTSGIAIYGSIQPTPRKYLSLKEFICKWDNRGTKCDWSDIINARSCTLCPAHTNCYSHCHPVLLQGPQQLCWVSQVTTKTPMPTPRSLRRVITAHAEAIHRKPLSSLGRWLGQPHQVLHGPGVNTGTRWVRQQTWLEEDMSGSHLRLYLSNPLLFKICSFLSKQLFLTSVSSDFLLGELHES